MTDSIDVKSTDPMQLMASVHFQVEVVNYSRPTIVPGGMRCRKHIQGITKQGRQKH